MATTYYYTVRLESFINKVWVISNTKTLTVPRYVTCRYIVNGYKNVDGVITQLTFANNKFRVTLGGSSTGVLARVGTEGPSYEVEVRAESAGVTYTPVLNVTYSPTNLLSNSEPITTFKANTVQISNKVTGPQTVSFTAATTGSEPEIPQYATVNGELSETVLSDVWQAIGGNVKNPEIKWNNVLKQWVFVKSVQVGNKYSVYLNYFNILGARVKVELVGTDDKAKGKNYTEAQKKLLETIQATITNPEPNSNNGETLDVVRPDKADSYNPPNHFFTRKPSFGDVLALTNNATIAQKISSTTRLGSIIADQESAEKLFKAKKGGTVKAARYGFRFTYNPTTISYSTTANSPIDYTYGSKDSANILGGPFNVSFDLYLNRIADVAELKAGGRGNNYSETLSEGARKGLLNRGTEYDLEFLYRIVNGSPEPTSLVSDGSLTSDFGFITGIPFWLKLHDNMNYYGGLNGLNVQHVMFSKDMVPILSVVNISFNRYPVFADSSSYLAEKYSQQYRDSLNPPTTDKKP